MFIFSVFTIQSRIRLKKLVFSLVYWEEDSIVHMCWFYWMASLNLNKCVVLKQPEQLKRGCAEEWDLSKSR